jgi:hypothetical protein
MKDLKLADGRDRLVRHGHGPERAVQTGIGPVEVSRVKIRTAARPVTAIECNDDLICLTLCEMQCLDDVRYAESAGDGGAWVASQAAVEAGGMRLLAA